MNQREKLIELLIEADVQLEYPGEEECERCDLHDVGRCDMVHMADYLLSNGVVVLPCKVGDTVYQVRKDFCDKRNLDKCDACCDGWDDQCPENNGELEIQTRVFSVGLFGLVGKGIYLTREEAEKALEKRKGGDK